MVSSKAHIRTSMIRNCRQKINDLVVHAKAVKLKAANPEMDEDETDVDDATHVIVHVDFLEAIGVWLDKALEAAKWMDDAGLPQGEIDHAYRVSSLWSLRDYKHSDTTDDPLGMAGVTPISARKPKGRESLR